MSSGSRVKKVIEYMEEKYNSDGYDVSTPHFKFAVADRVNTLCPFSLDGKDVKASDFLPTRARPKDTGYDVRCAEPDGILLEPFHYFKMRLGIRMFAPENWWTELKPRSGTFLNNKVHCLYGTIDETYENELCFAGVYIPDSHVLLPSNLTERISFGQRVAQLIPVYRQNMYVDGISNKEYDDLCKVRNDVRGTGGFGSSGAV